MPITSTIILIIN